jgi:hypothetical protein
LSAAIRSAGELFYRHCWLRRTPFPILATYGRARSDPRDLVQAALLICQTFDRQEKGPPRCRATARAGLAVRQLPRRLLVPMWSKQVLDRFRVVPL